jgi:hypothetical protein
MFLQTYCKWILDLNLIKSPQTNLQINSQGQWLQWPWPLAFLKIQMHHSSVINRWFSLFLFVSCWHDSVQRSSDVGMNVCAWEKPTVHSQYYCVFLSCLPFIVLVQEYICVLIYDKKWKMFSTLIMIGIHFLARRDDCPESYCHDPGVCVTPQGKNFNQGYIFWTIRDRMLVFHI